MIRLSLLVVFLLGVAGHRQITHQDEASGPCREAKAFVDKNHQGRRGDVGSEIGYPARVGMLPDPGANDAKVKNGQIMDQKCQNLPQTKKKRGRFVVASWYGPKFHGRTMANGQRFNMYALTVAHRTLPLGTELVLINPRNGKQVRVRVSDRGPYIHGRHLDVSYEVARKLHFVRRGVTRLQMQIIG